MAENAQNGYALIVEGGKEGKFSDCLVRKR
jgi:hypothetical protein